MGKNILFLLCDCVYRDVCELQSKRKALYAVSDQDGSWVIISGMEGVYVSFVSSKCWLHKVSS